MREVQNVSYKPKNELVAVTLTDHGDMRQWFKGDIVTLKWTHLDRSGEGEFRVVDAKRSRYSAVVEIELEAV